MRKLHIGEKWQSSMRRMHVENHDARLLWQAPSAATAIAVQNGGKNADRYHCVAVQSSAPPKPLTKGPRTDGDMTTTEGQNEDGERTGDDKAA